MSPPEPEPDAADQSAFARERPPHVDPDDPHPAIDPEALDTEALGEGGPSGA
jgi:hypothetical protein